MRHRKRRKRTPQQQADRHVCCRHAGRPMLTARRWLWLASAIAIGYGLGATYAEAVIEPLRLVLMCALPMVTCYGRGGQPLPASVPSTWGI